MSAKNDELEKVIGQYSSMLYKICFLILKNEQDTKDVLQETYLKLHSRIQTPHGQKIQNLRNYLFRTLANVCAKWQSGNSRIKTVPLDAKVDLADATADTSNDDDYKRIVKLLTEIPEEQAEVIRLRIYGDNSFAQIAEILSLPLPTVKSRFLYGLEKIRKGVKGLNVKGLNC